MKHRNLKWPHLKALHELYENESTNARILEHPFVKNLKEDKRLIALKPGITRTLVAKPGYRAYYEQHLHNSYLRYYQFLTQHHLDLSARQQFDEFDLDAFIFIADNKEELRERLSTIRHFSSLVFREKGSKFLEKHPGICKIIYQLLEVQGFPDQDPKNNQWRFVVDHPNPRIIVLCENLANLKRPWIAREHQLELWYVGGNNTTILEQIGADKLTLSIVYCCDWDLAGLRIYCRIKQIFSSKGKSISILLPPDVGDAIPISSQDHNSLWLPELPLSGLDADVFTASELSLITQLIARNKWIEEESQDLLSLLQKNGLITI
ncbi:hypothetical protein GFS24_17630 [Chitinophaga sp. SYP-B3965]|uniref:hypothetical protein n=1 Tax=Chitinophaga sp. SYP-B3965 TaxID=2663120 RepID=UPI001299710B|nr:hypothetical protein [Chitinophaga sp. SYP-B3965]MRG46947.1 hypothetical protein [Chitinophaga sp. SYP-B3965]